MRGPDGKLRDCYPVVMSFMVDYPEACLLCLVRTNYACPVCMVPQQDFSRLDKKYRLRTVLEMENVVAKAFACISKGDNKAGNKILQQYGLREQTVCMK
jgi:hypothetical protein